MKRWRAVWRLRLELALLALLVVVQRVLARPLGELGAVLVVTWVVLGILASPVLRRRLARWLYLAGLRRGWARAIVDCGLSDGPLRCGRVQRATPVAAGDELVVRVRRGQSVADLENRCDQLAACLRVREVRVVRDVADGALARVTLVRRDPFEGATPLPWPQCGRAERVAVGPGAGRCR